MILEFVIETLLSIVKGLTFLIMGFTKVGIFLISHLMDILLIGVICWGIGWIILYVRKRIKNLKKD